MENSRFISIHISKNYKEVMEYINTYESTQDHNWLCGIFNSTPYFSDVVRLIQAEQKNIIGYDAWRFQMDYSKHAIYKALKYKLNEQKRSR